MHRQRVPPANRARPSAQDRTAERSWRNDPLLAQGPSPAPGRRTQRLLDTIYSGQPFRPVIRDLGLTSNQVWGLTKTDPEWSEKLEDALMATRRDDLQHGTNAAYVAGCVCKACRDYQQERMGRR
jgi:hypothetical protein